MDFVLHGIFLPFAPGDVVARAFGSRVILRQGYRHGTEYTIGILPIGRIGREISKVLPIGRIAGLKFPALAVGINFYFQYHITIESKRKSSRGKINIT